MSQAITHTEYSAVTTRSKAQGRESLISKIFARLNTIAKIRRAQFSARPKHQSFIDANLLDATMGPEISRTLRR
jgi:hypothetical protein